MEPVEFQVDIQADAATRFAALSGDLNPLHVDPDYAAGTRFRRPILHGAYLAGLVSRMAGMHLPGTACLLHSIRLRFNAPVQPPVSVRVRGTLLSDDGEAGRARVTISDVSAGTLYAEAHYEFSRHERADPTEGRDSEAAASLGVRGEAPVLVTGASGALGSAVLEVLAAKGLGISRSRGTGGLQIPDLATISEHDLPDSIGGIVHCAWPAPDNQRLIELSAPEDALDHHLSRPLAAALALARLLAERGRPGAPLVLVGSTAADPGRHNYRMPLYTLAKSTIPVLARILALELAPLDRRCMAVTFDVIDGGMNADLSARARLVNVDRSPFGRLPTPVEAAEQIAWVIENRSFLASGATLHLTGGAIP